uniref:Isoleucine--tRNA ligase n=1 Tax=Lygus hesperus TaxID=30085 RepID=A0A0A9WH80_LYGHE
MYRGIESGNTQISPLTTLHNLVMSEHTEVDDVRPYTLNNVDSKKAFVKRVGVIPNSSFQIIHDFISIEKDLDNVYGFVPESIFYRMGRPIMWLERFVGQTAYRIDSGGSDS